MSGATREGTAEFATNAVKGNVVTEHFREAQGWTLSTIGLGTYLGEIDDATDDLYVSSILEAARLGCNVFDSASNYRCQRSERAIGRALRALQGEGVAREQLVVATKGGFIAYDGEPPADPRAYIQSRFLDTSIFQREDMSASGQVLAPGFLRHQLEQSLQNLGLETIDIYYLHNPEAQLGAVDRETFRARLRDAFEFLETTVSEGKIAFYGTATWNAYRSAPDAREFVSLEEVISLARQVGGDEHHCRFVQAPYNLAMTESFTSPSQTVDSDTMSLCQAIQVLGAHFVSSASIAQGRLTKGLPDWLGTLFKGFDTDTQRALQFVRSTPGLTTALVGMKTAEHVRENMAVAEVCPAPIEDFLKLFEVDSSN